jgi:predicted oxidoreductase
VQDAAEGLPGRSFWTIWDSNWPEQVPFFQPMHGSVNFVVDALTPENFTMMTVNPYILRTACDTAVADDSTTNIKANTIDELLDMMKDLADKETAKASIERYNQLAKAGKDEDFGKVASRLFPIETGPFYAFESGMSANLVCLGGLVSDENCRVYDNDGEIIEGLYAAGNVQGNRYAINYPISVKGVSHSLCLFYGYTAGKIVATL